MQPLTINSLHKKLKILIGKITQKDVIVSGKFELFVLNYCINPVGILSFPLWEKAIGKKGASGRRYFYYLQKNFKNKMKKLKKILKSPIIIVYIF